MKDGTVKLLLAVGAVAAIAIVVKKNGGIGGAVAGAVGALGSAVGDAATGVVYGIGDAVGIPRTDMTECERALAEGRTWDASFACPASNFLSSIWNNLTPDYSGYSMADFTGTFATRPIQPHTLTENAGGAAFIYPRLRRAGQ